MTDVVEAWEGITRRVRNTIDAPNVIEPNDPQLMPPPRWVVNPVGERGVPANMDGQTFHTVEVVVRVETAKDAFTAEHNRHVRRLVERFQVGDRFDGITIEEKPSPRGPFEGEGVYVTPVVIRGRCLS